MGVGWGKAQKGAYWQLSLMSSVVGLSFPAGLRLVVICVCQCWKKNQTNYIELCLLE